MACSKEKCDGGCKAELGKDLSGNCFRKPIEGRADTYEKKRAVMEKILAAWDHKPEQRLGQFLINVARQIPCPQGEGVLPLDVFYVEDQELAEYASKYGRS